MTFKCIKCDKPLAIQTVTSLEAKAIILGCPNCGIVIGHEMILEGTPKPIKPVWDALNPHERGDICKSADVHCQSRTLQKDWGDLTAATKKKLIPIFSHPADDEVEPESNPTDEEDGD